MNLTTFSLSNNMSRFLLILTAGLLTGTLRLAGQDYTPPVGLLRIEVAGGTVGQPAVTVFAAPMVSMTIPSGGIRSGTITDIADNRIRSRLAGWTPDSLASGPTRWLLKITSGVRIGLMLQISGNTSSEITVAAPKSAIEGVIAGQDRFELIPVPGMKQFFSAQPILSGVTSETADVVYRSEAGAWVGYFLHSPSGQWRRAGSTSTANWDDLGMLPDQSYLFARKGAAVSLEFIGRISTTSHRARVVPGIPSATNVGFPIAVTLTQLALHTRVAGWRASRADQLYLLGNGIWQSYYYNGTAWLNESGVNSGSVVVKAGAGLQIVRDSTAPGEVEFVYPTLSGLQQ